MGRKIQKTCKKNLAISTRKFFQATLLLFLFSYIVSKLLLNRPVRPGSMQPDAIPDMQMPVWTELKGCANPNFIHDKLLYIRKSCFAIAKDRECTKEGCKWGHSHKEIRRDIARMRKLTATRYRALEGVARVTARKANPKRRAKKERQST